MYYLHVLKSLGQDVTNVFWQVQHVGIVNVIMLTETELCGNLPCPRFNCVSSRKYGGLHYRVARALVALCPQSIFGTGTAATAGANCTKILTLY